MEDYTIESEILDSLEFLIPPVKKTLKEESKDRNYKTDCTKQPNIHLIRKLYSSKQNSTEATDFSSSNSVVIKKISKREFIRQIYKDDTEIPLIKVTVIPKAPGIQTPRVLRKRKHIVKRIQSTISNRESSIPSKNIYLVVAGQRSDKIYEIKTTESEKISSNRSSSYLKYEDISLKKLTDYKHIIQSLNMDKKRKKDKKKAAYLLAQNESGPSLMNETFGDGGSNLPECYCSNSCTKRKNFNYVKPRKSRVRITGQLGLTNQDKYVINYAATVDNHPVMANFTHVEQNAVSTETDDTKHSRVESSMCTSACCTNNGIYSTKKYLRPKRDSNVQANLLEPAPYRESSKSYRVRHRSQGTQVGLDKSFSTNKIIKKQYNDQTVQCTCNCGNVTDFSSTSDAATKSSTIKDSKSPLVVISVYPKRDATETVSSRTLMNQRQITSKRPTNTKFQRALKNNKTNASTSRSPSPANSNNNNINNHLTKNVDVRLLRTNNRMKNTAYQAAQNVRNRKSSPPTELSSGTTKSKTKTDFFKRFPVSFGSRDSREKQRRKDFIDHTKLPAVYKRDVGNSPSPPKKDSIVKVNIGRDATGRYDVIRRQRDLNNSQRVPRTTNHQALDKSSDDDYGSMENYLMLTEEEKNTEGSASQTLCYSIAYIVRASKLGRIDQTLDLFVGIKNKDHNSTSKLLSWLSSCQGPLLNVGFPHTLPQSTISCQGNSAFKKTDYTLASCFEDSCNPTFVCTKIPPVHLSCPMIVATVCSANCPIHLKHTTNDNATSDSTQQNQTDPVGNSESTKADLVLCTKLSQTSHSFEALYGSQSNANFFAPIKHYRGDSCRISNPLDRDKEIRELLGIQQGRRNLPRTVTHDYLSGIYSRDTQCKKSEQNTFKGWIEACKSKSKSEDCKCCDKDGLMKNNQCRFGIMKTDTTQCDLSQPTPCFETSPQTIDPCENQQLILNRNIQVYLQIEQFTKQKPIMLTRKQYNKLKKTIQTTVKLKNQREKDDKEKSKRSFFKNYSILSSEQTKTSSKKDSCFESNNGMQTRVRPKGSRKPMKRQSSVKLPKRYSVKERKLDPCVYQEVQTECRARSANKKFIYNTCTSCDKRNTSEDRPRQAISSLEIRYADVAYKRVAFSSTHLGLHTESNRPNERHNFIHYLLKRQNDRATPNLGTSASLNSRPSGSNQSFNYLLSPRDSKQKRPLLRRLMSCLVMHSARASEANMPCESKDSDVKSSVDSYYISTSLGAIEVTSSIYDTSASFYTTHTIVPINKIKRGFLSSVRGFLTSRRS